ncbi:MAG TPA: FlgT C-terminal domain-containing protein, partial [Candidatus Wallbacteria bacterium]|nr:FlgT C-terminal domain-containing protein [Candidatus Wallbacteria bacterium]
RSTLLGRLFGRSASSNIKTELMVFITPEITKTDGDFDSAVEKLAAPAVKEHIKKAEAGHTAGFVKKDRETIKVLSVSDDKVVISAGAANKMKKGEELRIVRPEKEYYHPETHQLISVEEKEIATIKIDTLKDKTALASIINLGSNENVLAGDLVLPEESYMVFENFRVTSMKFDLTISPDYLKYNPKTTFKIKNTTKKPMLKTKMIDNLYTRIDPKNPRKSINVDHDKYKAALIENGSNTELKMAEKKTGEGVEYQIFFNRIIGPDEEIELMLETNMIAPPGKEFNTEKFFNEANYYEKYSSGYGPKDSKTPFGISLNFPDKIIIRDFNFTPAVIDNTMGGTSLIWTHGGGHISLNGFWRFEDAGAVKQRLLKSTPQKAAASANSDVKNLRHIDNSEFKEVK